MDFQGKFSGEELEERLDKVKDMVGASDSQDGETGMVPAPSKGDNKRYLKGDGKFGALEDDEYIKELVKQLDGVRMRRWHDYYVVGWDGDDPSPEAVVEYGNKEYANDWDVFLLDTTDNEKKYTTPVGKLKRGNLLRFEDDSFAPVVYISEAHRRACDVALYVDEAAGTLAYEAGAYDAEAEWEIDKALIKEGGSPRALYDSEGTAVSHKVRPWETTETKYTIGLGKDKKVWVLDNVVGESGKTWAGIFGHPVIWDGIDISAYPLYPTAYSMSPVLTVGDQTRCFFYYDTDVLDSQSLGMTGVGDLDMLANNGGYPRTVDIAIGKDDGLGFVESVTQETYEELEGLVLDGCPMVMRQAVGDGKYISSVIAGYVDNQGLYLVLYDHQSGGLKKVKISATDYSVTVE